MWALVTQTNLCSVQKSNSMTIPDLKSFPVACMSHRSTVVCRRAHAPTPARPATENFWKILVNRAVNYDLCPRIMGVWLHALEYELIDIAWKWSICVKYSSQCSYLHNSLNYIYSPVFNSQTMRWLIYTLPILLLDWLKKRFLLTADHNAIVEPVC